MGGKYTESQKQASLRYQRDKSQLKITILPEQHKRYQKHAEQKGISLKQLIVELLEKDIESSK